MAINIHEVGTQCNFGIFLGLGLSWSIFFFCGVAAALGYESKGTYSVMFQHLATFQLWTWLVQDERLNMFQTGGSITLQWKDLMTQNAWNCILCSHSAVNAMPLNMFTTQVTQTGPSACDRKKHHINLHLFNVQSPLILNHSTQGPKMNNLSTYPIQLTIYTFIMSQLNPYGCKFQMDKFSIWT